MTDDAGLLEHAKGIVPRYEHGYCVDDVARGLAIACREPAPSAELISAAHVYLGFLAQAQAADGRFRNRMSYDRRWHGKPGTEDWWGRALWGLGTAAARGPDQEIRDQARAMFGRSAQLRSSFPHAMTFAALGAAEILDAWPADQAARGLLGDAAGVIGRPSDDPAWPWPAERLTYANAATAEAVICAGAKLGQEAVLQDGLRMLGWLLALETASGHVSVAGVGGWGRDDPRPAFDQQPIEVAALADACQRAASVTGDTSWLAGVELCVAWFLGDNDARIPMLDERTGGGCDGLRRSSRNGNQGAESTLAMISVLQLGSRLMTQHR